MIGDISLLGLGVFLGSLLIAMSFHEAMHGFTAHWLGDDTAHNAGRLTLNPLKHVDLLTTILLPVAMIAVGVQPILAAKPVPFNPWKLKYEEFGMALVGLAGPFTNLALAIVAAGIMYVSDVAIGTTAYGIFEIFIRTNIALFTFNLIPFPPLDGSRLLYAVAPEPVQKIMQQIEDAGFGITILVLIVLIPVIGPILGSVNDFIFNLLVSGTLV